MRPLKASAIGFVVAAVSGILIAGKNIYIPGILLISIFIAAIAYIVNSILTKEDSAVNLPKSNYEVGDVLQLGEISFRSYWGSIVTKDFEWLVLAIEGRQALIISLYSIEMRPFCEKNEDYCYWETSDIRSWLNGEFYNGIPLGIRNKIVSSNIRNNDVPEDWLEEELKALKLKKSLGLEVMSEDEFMRIRMNRCSSDKIFLLSVDEVQRYFGIKELEDSASILKVKTDFSSLVCDAIEKDGGSNIEEWDLRYGGHSWWLRSRGFFGKNPIGVVGEDGKIYITGENASRKWCCIRPAFWIRL